MTDKDKRLAWAYMALKDMVENNAYGNIMFNFQEGVIISSKKEVTEKPNLDQAA